MSLRDQALTDIVDDCRETLFLLGDATDRLQRLKKDIFRTKKYIDPSTCDNLLLQSGLYIKAFRSRLGEIVKLVSELTSGSPSLSQCTSAISIIRSAREFLRTHQTRIGALITSTDWQSPSYTYSMESQAGRQTNTIYATINDYKRDQHADAIRYERAFIKEYIDNWIKFPINAYATSSGMAAFTTILNFLLFEVKNSGPVLVGESSYFENLALIRGAFGTKVITVDESDTSAVLNTVKSKKPSVIFLDSLTNSPLIRAPDLNAIIPYIVKHASGETFLVIDNTCLSFFLQPLRYVFGKRTPVRLIVFESLNKYHQFGADRVTGGIIWTFGKETIKLFDYRVHLGTNIPDLVVSSLPAPNRKMLEKRLMRHDRNARLIASGLQTWISNHPGCPFTGISYPQQKAMTFHGSYLTILWKENYQTVPVYKRFVSMVVEKARKNRVRITAGTSFGLDTTRIYLTAIRSVPAVPFIRIAAGTEDMATMNGVVNVFIDSVSHFSP